MTPERVLAEHLRRRLLRLRVRGPVGEGAPLLRGDGLEFAELRGYAEGDDHRRIDWAATARSGELQTRVMLEESGLTLACAVDLGPRMALGRHRPLAESARELVRLWLGAARDRDRVALVVGSTAVRVGSLRGERAAAASLGHLGAKEDAFASMDGSTLAYLDATLPHGAALLLVGESYAVESLLGDPHLARLPRRCWCAAMIARDPWSGGLPLRGSVPLRDAVDGTVRVLRIDRAAAARHAEACERRERTIVERMERLGWRVHLFNEATSAAELLAAC